MEKFDLYNFDRTLSGKVIERGNPVPDGFYRLVVVTFVFNSKGQMLIQQRQKDKKNWSGLWDVSSSGHVQAVKWATKEEIFQMIDDSAFIPYNKGIIDFVFFQSCHEGTHERADWTKPENK